MQDLSFRRLSKIRAAETGVFTGLAFETLFPDEISGRFMVKRDIYAGLEAAAADLISQHLTNKIGRGNFFERAVRGGVDFIGAVIFVLLRMLHTSMYGYDFTFRSLLATLFIYIGASDVALLCEKEDYLNVGMIADSFKMKTTGILSGVEQGNPYPLP